MFVLVNADIAEETKITYLTKLEEEALDYAMTYVTYINIGQRRFYFFLKKK